MDKKLFGYIMKKDIYSEKIILDSNPQNIANFISRISPICRGLIVNDLDLPVISTFGNLIDRCEDKEYLEEILKYLLPMQYGEVDPFEIPLQYELYEFDYDEDCEDYEECEDYLEYKEQHDRYKKEVKEILLKEFNYIL